MGRKFEVQIYYTRFCTFYVEAENEEEAILKARKEELNIAQIAESLENWEEADTAEVVKNGES